MLTFCELKNYLINLHSNIAFYDLKNVDGAMDFSYSHKHTTNSAEDSSDMN